MSYFLEKARDNLHIVLAMSPAGDTLRIIRKIFQVWLIIQELISSSNGQKKL